MAALGMQGPYPFDAGTIDGLVNQAAPGTYALGRTDERGVFLVSYVGRADADLNATLKALLGKARRPLFKFRYAPSAGVAFAKHCENYHDFQPPANAEHPRAPDSRAWRCPRCKVLRVR